MLYVLLIAALIVIIALAVTNVRLRTRAEELVGLFERSTRDVAAVKAELETVGSQVEAVTKERDDAHERAQRARRDAAEIANRLRDETKAKTKAERSLKNAGGTVDRAIADADTDRAERDAARAARDEAVATRDKALKERDAATKERDAAVAAAAQVEAAAAEHPGLVAERDALVAERDDLVAERDSLVAERDARLAERDDALATRSETQVALEAATAASAAAEAALAAAEGDRAALDDARAAAEAAVAQATAELDEVRAQVDGLRRERDEAQAALEAIPVAADPEPVAAPEPAVAPTTAAGLDVDVVWALALARVDRTWRVSVAAGPDMASPLDDGDEQLRAAAEIEVDAAREEVGADIDLAWSGPGMIEPGAAVTALAVLTNLVAIMAKDAARAVLTVAVTDDAIDITTEATDESGASIPVRGPAALAVGAGHYRVARAG